MTQSWEAAVFEAIVARHGSNIRAELEKESPIKGQADGLFVLAPNGFQQSELLQAVVSSMSGRACVLDLGRGKADCDLIEELTQRIVPERPSGHDGAPKHLMLEEALESAASRGEEAFRCVLVGLDEVRDRLDLDQLSTLRAWADRDLMRFTYVGTEAPSELGRRIEESKFTDMFQRPLFLQPLDRGDLRVLLERRHLSLAVGEQELLIELSGGVPQLLAPCLKFRSKEKPKGGVVDAEGFEERMWTYIRSRSEATSLFASWWALVDESLDRSMKLLARGEQVKLPPSPERDFVADYLLLLRREAGGFRFRSSLFKRWLAEAADDGDREMFQVQPLIDRLKREVPLLANGGMRPHRNLEIASRVFMTTTQGDDAGWAAAAASLRHALEGVKQFALAKLLDRTGERSPVRWQEANAYLVRHFRLDESFLSLLNGLEDPLQKGGHGDAAHVRIATRARLMAFAAIAELLLDGLATWKPVVTGNAGEGTS